MAEKLSITKGNIGNALHSVAKDHVSVVADDTFDEELQAYQSALNNLSAIKDEEGNLQQTPFRYISNEEFVFAMVDAEDHFLFGIQQDGSVEWGEGIPSPVRKKLQEIITEQEQIKTDLKRNVLSIALDRSTGQIIGTTCEQSRITGCSQDRTTGKIIMNHQLE